MPKSSFAASVDGTLVEYSLQSFNSEKDLQRLIASNPTLLSGDEIDPQPRDATG